MSTASSPPANTSTDRIPWWMPGESTALRVGVFVALCVSAVLAVVAVSYTMWRWRKWMRRRRQPGRPWEAQGGSKPSPRSARNSSGGGGGASGGSGNAARPGTHAPAHAISSPRGRGPQGVVTGELAVAAGVGGQPGRGGGSQQSPLRTGEDTQQRTNEQSPGLPTRCSTPRALRDLDTARLEDSQCAAGSVACSASGSTASTLPPLRSGAELGGSGGGSACGNATAAAAAGGVGLRAHPATWPTSSSASPRLLSPRMAGVAHPAGMAASPHAGSSNTCTARPLFESYHERDIERRLRQAVFGLQTAPGGAATGCLSPPQQMPAPPMPAVATPGTEMGLASPRQAGVGTAAGSAGAGGAAQQGPWLWWPATGASAAATTPLDADLCARDLLLGRARRPVFRQAPFALLEPTVLQAQGASEAVVSTPVRVSLMAPEPAVLPAPTAAAAHGADRSTDQQEGSRGQAVTDVVHDSEDTEPVTVADEAGSDASNATQEAVQSPARTAVQRILEEAAEDAADAPLMGQLTLGMWTQRASGGELQEAGGQQHELQSDQPQAAPLHVQQQDPLEDPMRQGALVAADQEVQQLEGHCPLSGQCNEDVALLVQHQQQEEAETQRGRPSSNSSSCSGGQPDASTAEPLTAGSAAACELAGELDGGFQLPAAAPLAAAANAAADDSTSRCTSKECAFPVGPTSEVQHADGQLAVANGQDAEHSSQHGQHEQLSTQPACPAVRAGSMHAFQVALPTPVAAGSPGTADVSISHDPRPAIFPDQNPQYPPPQPASPAIAVASPVHLHPNAALFGNLRGLPGAIPVLGNAAVLLLNPGLLRHPLGSNSSPGDCTSACYGPLAMPVMYGAYNRGPPSQAVATVLACLGHNPAEVSPAHVVGPTAGAAEMREQQSWDPMDGGDLLQQLRQRRQRLNGPLGQRRYMTSPGDPLSQQLAQLLSLDEAPEQQEQPATPVSVAGSQSAAPGAPAGAACIVSAAATDTATAAPDGNCRVTADAEDAGVKCTTTSPWESPVAAAAAMGSTQVPAELSPARTVGSSAGKGKGEATAVAVTPAGVAAGGSSAWPHTPPHVTCSTLSPIASSLSSTTLPTFGATSVDMMAEQEPRWHQGLYDPESPLVAGQEGTPALSNEVLPHGSFVTNVWLEKGQLQQAGWPASGASGPEGPLATKVAERLMTNNPLFQRGEVAGQGDDVTQGADSAREEEDV
ncbi:hypothetical protein Agub_g9059 [Astrephomene gubernaculifera]|uniref:Uncharacterized protein n=1 Tax=Astrephomene gubernaculifera TaxID=47775 RepID=A0AAD3DSM1_9CHLO|nr:hypothetical protein Agub_g9059 [Astrephomene gubernaculifera]